jgi:hypothetical protein
MKKSDGNLFFINSKHGQVTIFVVIGILMIGAIALFFFLRKGIAPQTGGKPEANFNAFLSSCLEQKVRDSSKNISLNGGYLEPSDLSIRFKFTDEGVYRNISFLCFTQNNFRPCVNQKPTLFLDFEKEMKDAISNDVENCFKEMSDSFKNQGYDVNSQYNDFDVLLSPGKITIQTDSEVTLQKSGQTTTEKNFAVVVQSRIYEIIKMVDEILSQEAQYCYSESAFIEITYPDYTIDKFNTEDFVKIYTVKYKGSDENFRFAVRGCSSPQGF